MSQDLINRGKDIQNRSEEESITPQDVGGWMEDAGIEFLKKAPLEELQALNKKLDDFTTNDRGIYATLADLKTDYPDNSEKNKAGFFAFVGASNPRRKYKINVDKGSWIDTGEDHNVADVDLADYATKENIDGDQVVYAPNGIIEVPKDVLTHSTSSERDIYPQIVEEGFVEELLDITKDGVYVALNDRGDTITIDKYRLLPNTEYEIQTGNVTEAYNSDDVTKAFLYSTEENKEYDAKIDPVNGVFLFTTDSTNLFLSILVQRTNTKSGVPYGIQFNNSAKFKIIERSDITTVEIGEDSIDITDKLNESPDDSLSVPLSISDGSNNDIMRVYPDGSVEFGNLLLPKNITDMIDTHIKNALANVSVTGSGEIFSDRDAKIFGLGSRNFCFIHLSDTHSYLPAFDKVKEVVNHYPVIDAMIHSGDVIEGGGAVTFFNKINSTDFKRPLMWTMGNHDNEGGVNTKAEQYQRYIAPNLEKWGAVTQENRCYYYKDFAGYAIRLITLDLHDNDTLISGGATPTMSQTQVDWLVATLIDSANEGLSVIINSHYAGGTTLVRETVAAFVNGVSLQKTYTLHGSERTVNANFTKKGDFITYLSGHAHADANGWLGDQRYKQASFAGILHNQDDLVRSVGSPTEHNFDIVIVDKPSKKLFTFRIGAAYSTNYGKTERNYAELELNYIK